MPISKKEIISQYNFFKKAALTYLNKRKIAKSAPYIEAAARFGYTYNFRYTDDELESYIQQISKLICNDNIHFAANPNRVIFYDSFAINRILALQYLRAINSWGSELIYITPNELINKDILNELKKNPNTKIIKGGCDHSFEINIRGGCYYSFEVNILNTVNAIKAFKPKYAFLHCTPWDIFGFSLWNIFDNNVERYLINLCDHGFWLGKHCADYYLEFRKHGCSISYNHRGIPVEKLLMQPFYPIQFKTEFQGFPIVKGSKTIAFAGSASYKIYGRNNLFLNLIKSILEHNKNVIFLFADGGVGPAKPLKTFIKKNNLADRFFLLGDRNDIDQIIKNIDIYVNTFPMIGGLMTQLAAINSKPIIGFTDLDLLSFNDAEDILKTKCKGLLVKTSEYEFIDYFNRLLNNESERKKNILCTTDCIITPDQFNRLLYKNISTHEPITKSHFRDVKIDINSICEYYIDIENNYLNQHYIKILMALRKQIFFDNFFLGLKALFYSIMKIINTPKDLIRHIRLKYTLRK